MLSHTPMIPKPKWSRSVITSPMVDKTWPKNLMGIIRAIKTMPPCCPTQPEYTFDLTPKATAKNYLVLMKKYKGNLGASLKGQHDSTVGYGSESRDINTLQNIFGQHPHWTRMYKILRNGTEWPLKPSDEELRRNGVDVALAFRNHKGASLQPKLFQQPVSKDVQFGYCLPLPLDKARTIPGILLTPMNIQKQTNHQQTRANCQEGLPHPQPKL